MSDEERARNAEARITELEGQLDTCQPAVRYTGTQLQAADRDIKALINAKDEAYAERNQLVVALAKVFPSHVLEHPHSDAGWEPEWRTIVCVHGPNGQMTWHFHDSERQLLAFLGDVSIPSCAGWDGHSTQEKYARLARLTRAVRGAVEQTSLRLSQNCTDLLVRADRWTRPSVARSGDETWIRAESSRTGFPVACANHTAPGCAIRAGPRGPSTAKPAARPAAISRAS